MEHDRPRDEKTDQLRLTPRRLSEFIRRSKQAILIEWETAVRTLPVAQKLAQPVLVDHIPELLEEIASLADRLADGESPQISIDVAERHALDRLDEGFDLSQVVAEFAALRDCVMRLWEREFVANAVIEDLRILNHAIDRAVSASVQRYTRARDRALHALDRIANAALDSRDLDDLLQRLLAVLCETTPAVDAAAIFLAEGERLALTACVGLEVAPRTFSVAIGEGFAGSIAADRKPRMMENAAQDPSITSAAFWTKGIRALFGVPLIDAGALIGVAAVGSTTAPVLSEQDCRLVIAMANRATAAINHHVLRAAAERRAEILELGEACVVVDRNWRIIFVNRHQERLSATPRAATLGKTLAEVWPELIYPDSPLWRELERAMHERVAGEIETYFAPLQRWASSSIFPLADGSVAIFFRDTTEKKGAERALQAAHRDAERALAISEAILSGSPIAIGVIDRDMRYVRLNEALARISNKPVDEHIGHTVREVMGDIADTVEPMIRTVVDSGRPLTNVEISVAPGAPAQTVWLASFSPVRVSNGELLGVGTAIVDITEQKRAERALAQAVRQREHVLAVVSHDLRTPLNAVDLAAELALPLVTEAKPRKHLETIHRASGKMSRLIDDLLDMASIQAGRLALRSKPEDATALVVEAIELCEPAARAKGITLVGPRGDQPLYVLCDRNRIAQVLGNLLGNAVKFCSKGDTITLTVEPDDGCVRLAVNDTGPGMDAETAAHAFEPYWSAREHAAQGTGLGLSIARGIVEAHGGHIEVVSTRGKGTTVAFTLPSSGNP